MCQASELIGNIHCESVAQTLTRAGATHTVQGLVEAGLTTVSELDTVPKAELIYDHPTVSQDLRQAVTTELDWQTDTDIRAKLEAMLDKCPAAVSTVQIPVKAKPQPVAVGVSC